jgi:hypothetical protein
VPMIGLSPDVPFLLLPLVNKDPCPAWYKPISRPQAHSVHEGILPRLMLCPQLIVNAVTLKGDVEKQTPVTMHEAEKESSQAKCTRS